MVNKPGTTTPVLTFTELVNKYSLRVYNIAYRLTGNPTDAEDLTQDAFLRIYRNLHRFNSEEDLVNCLYQIILNLYRNKVRYLKRHTLPTENLTEKIEEQSLVQEPGPEQIVDRNELVNEILKILNPYERFILVFRYIEEKTFTEIAKILNRPVTSVQTRLRLISVKLHKLFLPDKGEKNKLRMDNGD